MSSAMRRQKTGEKCSRKGVYQWDGYVDGTRFPSTSTEEREIPLDVGDKFPPVKSCNKAAFWVYLRSC